MQLYIRSDEEPIVALSNPFDALLAYQTTAHRSYTP